MFWTKVSHQLNQSKYCLVDMYTSCNHAYVKKKAILDAFTSESPLQVVITTVAYGMGVDCPDIRCIIHLGPTEDIENYVQQAGHDGKPSFATLLF